MRRSSRNATRNETNVPKKPFASCIRLVAMTSVPIWLRIDGFKGIAIVPWLSGTIAWRRQQGDLHVVKEPTPSSPRRSEVEDDPVALLKPAGNDVLKVWPVSKQMNSPKKERCGSWWGPVGSRFTVACDVSHQTLGRRYQFSRVKPPSGRLLSCHASTPSRYQYTWV